MKYYLLLLFLVAALFVGAQQSSFTESIFQKYFRQAQVFSVAYPQEKVHLHFDNTSYYAGDTIWFKAYVTQGVDNQPTTLSEPLYVELLDQLGHVIDKQIVKIQNGEGQGQFPLEKSDLSGYYEVRSFTKWMLAFHNEYYFSRTFPIYRPVLGAKDEERSIATYNMNSHMKQRPKQDTKKLSLRFFPEGGQLIEGVTSVIAFKAESKKEGAVDIDGVLRTKRGEELTTFKTLHDGMGCLSYTPHAGEEVEAEVTYKGDIYKFSLPKAISQGYVLNVTNREQQLDIRVIRNEVTPSDSLALFISHQGEPLLYNVLSFGQKQAELLRVPTDKLPAGIIQLSLINSTGNILAERSCYIIPRNRIQLTAQTDNTHYYPYAPIRCRVEAKDETGQPLETNLSVSIRSTLHSDYLEYDNNICTDLLLTSELKGYIHQPGYYFAENSTRRKQELNVLMMVHGWKKYDLEKMVSKPPVQPRYLPEKSLIIQGQLKSYIKKKSLDNLEVSILAKKKEVFMLGKTLSDSLGKFRIPVKGVEGMMPTSIQTRKPGSKRKQLCSVLLFRNLSPELRSYSFYEWNPQWKSLVQLRNAISLKDSLYIDSIRKLDPYFLAEVIVKARYPEKRTLRFETSIRSYYDVQAMVDQMRDEGEEIFTLSEFLYKVDPAIQLREGKKISYNDRALMLVIDGKITRKDDQFLISEDIDAIKTLTICSGVGASDEVGNLIFDENIATEGLEDINNDMETQKQDAAQMLHVSLRAGGPPTICYIVSANGWDGNKDFRPSRGVRVTRIQGYIRPLKFYSPAYLDGALPEDNDKRRTLYWNPNVKTDKDGCAVIECYNTNSTTSITVSAETICDGKPGAVVTHSVGL